MLLSRHNFDFVQAVLRWCWHSISLRCECETSYCGWVCIKLAKRDWSEITETVLPTPGMLILMTWKAVKLTKDDVRLFGTEKR